MESVLQKLEELDLEQKAGTVQHCNNFIAVNDANQLRDAMRGLGTNEQQIIDILASRTNKQRQQIKNAYKQLFGRVLEDDLTSELSGNFRKTVLALLEMPTEYLAKSLKNATSGLGTREKDLIEILCTCDNRQIRSVRAVYKKLYNNELEEDIRGDTSSNFCRFLVTLCHGDRDENEEVDKTKAVQDAKLLYNAGEERTGTDEQTFHTIFTNRSYPQLQATFLLYAKLSTKDITEAIESEFSGYIKQALLAIVNVSRSVPGYLALCLKDTMEGLGTDNTRLIRLIVSRSEIDMQQIKKAFNLMYKKPLADWIEEDTSGDFKKVLLAML